MSRRDEITMTAGEVETFLQGRHTMTVATVGPDGRPHLVAMWYGFHRGAPAFWTYARSQKAVNLRRDPRLTCLVDDGDSYDTLRGVELVGRGTLLEDPGDVLAVGTSVFERYTGPAEGEARAGLERSAAKRVAVRVEVERVVSWDHAKLGGGY
ncbi:MAG: TIGR03618 family F420-dependent PPOX class oxidoreductase [Acidimicrobiales bacterium]